MARIRTIKPEFPQSESMGRVSRDARLLFLQLWTLCDDAGRTRGTSRMLASLLYPYDDDAPKLIDGWLAELQAEGCVEMYMVSGSHYLEVCNWLKHQKIDKPSRSSIPSFDESSRILANPLEVSSEDQGPKDQGPRTKGEDQGDDSLRSSSSSPADDDQPDTAVDEPLLEQPLLLTIEDARSVKTRRLCEVTADAIRSFNKSPITKAMNGRVSNVTLANDVRKAQVARCIKVAADICKRVYGTPVITTRFWRGYWGIVADDDFSSGRSAGGNGHEKWVPDFEYLTRPATMTKLFDKAMSEMQTEAAAHE